MNRDIDVLDTKDLQVYLRVGKDKAYALMKSDIFPSTKIGSKYIVTYDNLQEWLRQSAGREIIL